MLEVRQTPTFVDWLEALRDRAARARVLARLRRIELGNLGDVRSVGDGVSEARIDHGPGYRLYFCRRGAVVVIMLCAGDKSSQTKDIERAKSMAKEY